MKFADLRKTPEYRAERDRLQKMMSSAKQPKFEVIKAKDGWRWRLISANGRIIATGEAHTREADAWRAVETVAETAPKARQWKV